MLQLLNDFPFARTNWANDLARELDRFFTPVRDSRKLSARVNVLANEDAAKVMVSLPGWKPEWFDLSTEGNRLFIKGASQFEDEARNFSVDRTVNLPFRVEEGSVEATYEQGVLLLTLHRSEKDKPRKITVNAA